MHFVQQQKNQHKNTQLLRVRYKNTKPNKKQSKYEANDKKEDKIQTETKQPTLSISYTVVKNRFFSFLSHGQ